MFYRDSRAIIYGRHVDVAERMLDFDSLCGRGASVAGFVDPSVSRVGYVKVFFGSSEALLPVYPSIASIPADVRADVFLNLASFRSAGEATREALRSRRFETIAIIAEGIPEREVREIIALNDAEYHVRIIGPATVGGIAAGSLRIGNTGGSLDNIVRSKLYRAGSVGFVSRSGGMSNEMNRVIADRTDGVHTSIALGGDRFVAASFRDIVLDYERTEDIRMIVLLGEVGGTDELAVAELLREGAITKPVVAYVSGSFAETLATEIQFGHAGAKANADTEKASAKNRLLREAGAHVPESYRDFGDLIARIFASLGLPERDESALEREVAARVEALRHRRNTPFTSTVSDDRGEEVTFDHIPVSDFAASPDIARVIGHLWLRRELPDYALDFVRTVMTILADHGPAVSGATTSIIASRAGKDIASSVIAGLATVGPRFGGAIDGAMRHFYDSVRSGTSPREFMDAMKSLGTPIPGIGHKVKSQFNPDTRCTILLDLAARIPSGRHVAFARELESLTLQKKSNLILNVDGVIAAALLDIFEALGMDDAEADMYVSAGIGNAFFIASRTIGFIAHALDQKRLGEGLYRTGWDDILYAE